jgi:hypothetical protein
MKSKRGVLVARGKHHFEVMNRIDTTNGTVAATPHTSQSRPGFQYFSGTARPCEISRASRSCLICIGSRIPHQTHSTMPRKWMNFKALYTSFLPTQSYWPDSAMKGDLHPEDGQRDSLPRGWIQQMDSPVFTPYCRG